MKTAKEYLLDKIGGNNPDKYDQKILELIAYWMEEYAKYYHEQQVKSVDLADVLGQSEQLKCQCKKAKFTRTVDADFNPLCGRCGKTL